MPRCLALSFSLMMSFAPLAQAQTIDPLSFDPLAQPVVAQLEREGYSGIRVYETWLGRLRIIAMIDGRRREVILHPTSGAILRDYLEPPIRFAEESDDDDDDDDDGQAVAADVPQVAVTPVPETQVATTQKPPRQDSVTTATQDDMLLLSVGE